MAFFPGLVRGEFHFATADDIASVAAWPARARRPAMMVVDRTGSAARALARCPRGPGCRPRRIDDLCGRFANWLVLAHHLAARGELLRAWTRSARPAASAVDGTARRGRTEHWLTPSRAAETDLPPAVLPAVHAATATADPVSLGRAIAATWEHGRQCWERLADRTGRPVPEALFDDLRVLRRG